MGFSGILLSQSTWTNNNTGNDKEFDGLGVNLALGYSFRVGEKVGLPLMFQWRHTAGSSNSLENTEVVTIGIMY